MAAQSERSLDAKYISKTNGVTRTTMKATICVRKLDCGNGHKLTIIRPPLVPVVVQFNCDGCNQILAIVNANHRNGADYLYGCRKCNYHICRTCFDQQQIQHKYD